MLRPSPLLTDVLISSADPAAAQTASVGSDVPWRKQSQAPFAPPVNAIFPPSTSAVGAATTMAAPEYTDSAWSPTRSRWLPVSLADVQWIQLMRVSSSSVQVSISGVVDHSGCAAVHAF
jgi:hypothetical protein